MCEDSRLFFGEGNLWTVFQEILGNYTKLHLVCSPITISIISIGNEALGRIIWHNQFHGIGSSRWYKVGNIVSHSTNLFTIKSCMLKILIVKTKGLTCFEAIIDKVSCWIQYSWVATQHGIASWNDLIRISGNGSMLCLWLTVIEIEGLSKGFRNITFFTFRNLGQVTLIAFHFFGIVDINRFIFFSSCGFFFLIAFCNGFNLSCSIWN